jgi:hypothetical protein
MYFLWTVCYNMYLNYFQPLMQFWSKEMQGSWLDLGDVQLLGIPLVLPTRKGLPMGLLGYSMNDGSAIGIAHQVVPSGEWESQRTIPQMLGVPVELPMRKWESQRTIPEIVGVPVELPTKRWESHRWCPEGVGNPNGLFQKCWESHWSCPCWKFPDGSIILPRLLADYHFLSVSISTSNAKKIAYLCKQHYWNGSDTVSCVDFLGL